MMNDATKKRVHARQTRWSRKRSARIRWTASALRVLGLDYREVPAQHSEEHLTRELTFVGFVGMNARSRARWALTSSLFTNGWLWGATLICVLLQLAAVNVRLLQDVLHNVPLAAADWGLIAAGALVPVVDVELVKLVQRWRRRGRDAGAEPTTVRFEVADAGARTALGKVAPIKALRVGSGS